MHEIVPILERKIQLIFPECREHSGQRCEVSCKTCNQPVCVKCIGLDPHKGHDIEELTETHENKIRKIKSDTWEIRANIIPKFRIEDQKIEYTISTTKSKIDDLGKERKQLRRLWHQEVDNIFDKIDSLSQSLGEENLNDLQKYHNKIRNLISEMNKTVKQNEKLFNSKNILEVNEYQSKLNRYQNFPGNMDLKFPFLGSNIDKGKELSIEIGGYTATLKQMSQSSLSTGVSRLTTGIEELMEKVRVIATIPNTFIPLWDVACVGETEVWIHGTQKFILRIDIHGTVWEIVYTTCLDWPNGISVTRERELMYSDDNSGTVNIVRDRKSESLITTPSGWTPANLCCIRSGDILVHVYGKSGPQRKNKIIRYQGKNIKQEINNDGQGNPIFKDGYFLLFISENNNGDVCVSDANALTVVVVDKMGKVRFRYDGTPARREKSFAPRGIVTDALSQIIMTDINNDCLHILDQNGQFLRCVDDCRLESPHGLSVDSEGRLWVGSGDSGNINVITYL
uniref:Uncharacterized protein LOC111116932 n=1 Tax=Crassostrea virginica TaxID=6565 RepID=A0A8B8C7T6_CRAVI|nr:uncharacterized protein LOC111116932 [Crassostrea virginica]